MSKFGKMTRLAVLCLGMAVFGLTMGPVSTVQADEGFNTGNVSVSGGVDYYSQYWFRGLAQENQDYIVQPWVDVAFAVYTGDDDSFVKSVDIYTGIWTSLHGGPSGVAGAGTGMWYEADYYFGVALGLPGGFGLDISYINLYNPNGAGIFAEEIDVALSYDDSDLWGDSLGGDFALNPSILVAFEIDGGSDAGASMGVYFEVAIAPEFEFVVSDDLPVTVVLPVTLGFGDDYYEIAGTDDGFGYVDFGVDASIPLNFIPAEYGAWSLSAGVHIIILGDNAENIAGGTTPGSFGVTSGNSTEVYGFVGISFAY